SLPTPSDGGIFLLLHIDQFAMSRTKAGVPFQKLRDRTPNPSAFACKPGLSTLNYTIKERLMPLLALLSPTTIKPSSSLSLGSTSSSRPFSLNRAPCRSGSHPAER